MTQHIHYHISPEYLSDGICTLASFDKDNLKLTEAGDYTFYENDSGDWLFETTGKTKTLWQFLEYKYIDNAMRDHCYLDEDDVFKHIRSWQDQVAVLNNKIESLIYEAGLQDIDINEELCS